MEKDELTYNIIGCAMKVHNKLGPGFQKVIYQRCLAIELERAGLKFEREKEHTIYYVGSQSLQHKLLFNPKYFTKPNSENSLIQ